MTRLVRRAFVAGAFGFGAAEALSLTGAFDHRHSPRASARESARYALAADGCGVVHVGHSTHVLSLGGRRVLTDPWFSDPAFGALEHTRGPACSPEDLTGLDAVLVSHEHPDHADLAALERLPDKARAVVLVATEALERKLQKLGCRSVRRIAPWETHDLDGALVHAVPAVHDVPEIGFVVVGGGASVYFAGDTAFHPDLAAIAERYRPTFAILPVDGTRLRGSASATMNAVEATRATRLLGVRGVMPSHTEARFTDPFVEHVLTASSHAGVERFRREVAARLPYVRWTAPEPGERVEV
jgi:L-ascorbate metabolism protein UlaG (beta-lactamase superfamily)